MNGGRLTAFFITQWDLIRLSTYTLRSASLWRQIARFHKLHFVTAVCRAFLARNIARNMVPSRVGPLV